MDVLSLLLRYRQFQSTDPRDQIYALNGLMEQSRLPGVCLPDYVTGWATKYRDFAIACMESSGTLDILSGVYSTGRNELQSWIPDWRQAIPTMPLVQRLYERSNLRFQRPRPRFSATSTSKCIPRLVEHDDNALVLHGFNLDRVVARAQIYPFGTDQIFSHWDGLRSVARRIRCLHSQERVCGLPTRSEYLPTKESRSEACWQTLCAGVTGEGREASRSAYETFCASMRVFRPMQKFHLRWCEPLHLFALALKEANLFRKSPMGHGMEFVELSSPVLGRRTCRTKNGLIGLVPAATRIDDRVCLLQGSTVPFVVRSNDDGSWRVVGESYVHGAMYGEHYDPGRCGEMVFR